MKSAVLTIHTALQYLHIANSALFPLAVVKAIQLSSLPEQLVFILFAGLLLHFRQLHYRVEMNAKVLLLLILGSTSVLIYVLILSVVLTFFSAKQLGTSTFPLEVWIWQRKKH